MSGLLDRSTARLTGNGGVAPIKKEYVLLRPDRNQQEVIDDDVAERKTNHVMNHDGPDKAEQKLSGAARKRLKKAQAAEDRKQKRGMNTNRRFNRIRDEHQICNHVARAERCSHGDSCKFSHSVSDYLQNKAKDVRFPCPPSTSKFGALWELDLAGQQAYLDKYYSDAAEPFTHFGESEEFGSVDMGTHCPVVSAQSRDVEWPQQAFCYAGWTCRFLGGHVRRVADSAETAGFELLGEKRRLSTRTNGLTGELDGAEREVSNRREASDELNWMNPSIPRTLKTREYPLYLTKAALDCLEREKEADIVERGPILFDVEAAKRRYYATQPATRKSATDEADEMDALMNEQSAAQQAKRLKDAEQSESLTDLARIRPGEKRRLDWFHDELYLAPLTTTGNLPFRRLCVSFGADITCGEMGLADSYLRGSKNEWSLVRRWNGERCFGTQVCGSKPDLLVPTAEVLAREFPTGLDFIDVNCGCPIDMVFTKGAGSALLDHHARLGRIVRGMNAVSGDVPITVKLRTGTSSQQTTHRLFPKLNADWGVAAATLHGRSRQQRYKHTADWSYIKRCTDAFRESIVQHNEERPDEDWVHRIPIYGNGDVYSWQDYESNKRLTGVDGQMIARGGLVKPWLFTEIKERRDWDISSRERLDIVRQLCSYGVSHWGSDTVGVNSTRRFVCEALSFMHRYIPVGLLERLPVHMHDRPPPFKGRNELETLLASSNANDWVRITEMFLGKAPEQFAFVPKHKSNSYEAGTGGEDQG